MRAHKKHKSHTMDRILATKKVYNGITVLHTAERNDNGITMPSSASEEDVIARAIADGYPVIHRRPDCQWYLKGNKSTPEQIENDIRKNINKRDTDGLYSNKYKNVCVWVLTL